MGKQPRRSARFIMRNIAAIAALLSLAGCLDILGFRDADVEVRVEPVHTDDAPNISLVIENHGSDKVYLWNTSALEVREGDDWQSAYKGPVALFLGIIAEIEPGETYEPSSFSALPAGEYRYRARLSEDKRFESGFTRISSTIFVSPYGQ